MIDIHCFQGRVIDGEVDGKGLGVIEPVLYLEEISSFHTLLMPEEVIGIGEVAAGRIDIVREGRVEYAA
jgi:hypothetical protein